MLARIMLPDSPVACGPVRIVRAGGRSVPLEADALFWLRLPVALRCWSDPSRPRIRIWAWASFSASGEMLRPRTLPPRPGRPYGTGLSVSLVAPGQSMNASNSRIAISTSQ